MNEWKRATECCALLSHPCNAVWSRRPCAPYRTTKSQYNIVSFLLLFVFLSLATVVPRGSAYPRLELLRVDMEEADAKGLARRFVLQHRSAARAGDRLPRQVVVLRRDARVRSPRNHVIVLLPLEEIAVVSR